MIDLSQLRDNPERFRDAAAAKRINVDIDKILKLDAEHRKLLTEQQQITAEKNMVGRQIGQLAPQLKNAVGDEKLELQQKMKQMQQRPTQLKQREQELGKLIGGIESPLNDLLLHVPQPPDQTVPVGTDDSDNVELRKWGEVRKFDFEPKDHVTLGRDLGMIDIERGVKLSGTRSYFLTGRGALLHQAVLRLAFDRICGHGFKPMTPPVMVRQPALVGTGYFPLGRDQTYAMTNEDPELFLVGTAEVPLMSYHMDEILDETDLPRRYVAQSSCFRREAGTYGKDTHGLYRIHQFDKVEQVVLCKNDIIESKGWHEKILSYAEQLLQELKLPYRVVDVCTGELGQGQVAKFDIETWMPSRESYGETHSASRFYDFQARRLNVRYRDGQGKVQFCHSLNNTVIASPRILIPLMELYQNPDGSICIPKALTPYMNGMEKIDP